MNPRRQDLMAVASGDWSARNQGSGTFIITKPQRKKAKMRRHRLKNRRRAR
jgi:hypothetical protein